MHSVGIIHPILLTINNDNSCQSGKETIDKALSAVFINKVVASDCQLFPYLKHVFIYVCVYIYTGLFVVFSMIKNIYNKKTKGPTLMELFTATGKLKIFF
jgi:hypothetical protein